MKRLAVALAGAGALGVAAVAVLASGSSSRPPAAHEYLPSLSLGGSEVPGGIGRACGAAADSRGDLYLADCVRGEIDVFGPGREYLGALRDPHGACGLAVDSHGALYALQAGGDVVKYLPSSYPFRGAPAYGAPRTIDASGDAKAIAVDSFDNRLFVAAGDRVDVYKANGVLGQNEVQRVLVQGFTGGSFTLSFEGKTTAPLPYDATHAEVRAALARLPTIGRGNVLVREGTNGPRDHFITFTGALGRREVGMLRADASKLKGPGRRFGTAFQVERLVRAFSGQIGAGLLHDAIGVAAYTYDGSYSGVGGLLAESPGLVSGPPIGEGGRLRLAGLGGQSPRPAAFVFVNHLPSVYRGYSHYVSVAERGRILVLAGPDIRHLHRIATIEGAGTPTGNIDLGSAGASLGVDPATGHLFAWDATHSSIEEFEVTGAYVGRIENSGLGEAGTMGVAVVPSPAPEKGTLYATAGRAGALAFGPLRPRSHAPRTGFSVKLPEACGTAVDSRGDLYVSGEKEIRVLDPQGRELSRIADPHDPCRLAVDSHGNLYATENGASEYRREVVVYEARAYPPSGSLEYAKPKRIAPLGGWLGWLAVVPANDRLLVNSGELEIAEYGSLAEGSGLIRRGIGRHLISDLESFNGGLAVCARNGDIVASGRGFFGQWRIYVMNSAGTLMRTRIDGSGSPKGPFKDHGTSLALDQSDCHAFITLIGHRVEEYEPSGTFVGEFGPKLPFFAGALAVDNGPSSPNRGDVYVASYEGVSAFGPLGFGG